MTFREPTTDSAPPVFDAGEALDRLMAGLLPSPAAFCEHGHVPVDECVACNTNRLAIALLANTYEGALVDSLERVIGLMTAPTREETS